METFTIQDMLINSTDFNQILCNFGIKNISDCGDEEESAVEPKGRVNFSTFPPKIDAFQSSRIGRIFLAESASLPYFQREENKLSFCRELTRCGHLFLRQRALRIWFRSSGSGLLQTSCDTYVASSALWRSAQVFLSKSRRKPMLREREIPFFWRLRADPTPAPRYRGSFTDIRVICDSGWLRGRGEAESEQRSGRVVKTTGQMFACVTQPRVCPQISTRQSGSSSTASSSSSACWATASSSPSW